MWCAVRRFTIHHSPFTRYRLDLVPEDYFIGVDAQELERLRQQHAAWGPETRALWNAAGFGAGQHLADLGSGPGFSTLDLAELVGPAGRVSAFDKASIYLGFLRDETHRRNLTNVDTVETDISKVDVIGRDLDGAFCRFFLAFLIDDLDRVLKSVYDSLKPGGVLAAMEYLTVESATCSPPVRGFDAHTQAWVRYYAANGGDTRVGSILPAKLVRAGFTIAHASCVGGMANPAHRWWAWWGRLMEDFGDRLVAEGLMNDDELQGLRHDWREVSGDPQAFIYTPILVQIVARKDP